MLPLSIRVEVIATSAARIVAPNNGFINTILTIPVPPLGPNDVLDVTSLWTTDNNGNNIFLSVLFGGVAFLNSENMQSQTNLLHTLQVSNRNARDVQLGFGSLVFAPIAFADPLQITTANIDTSRIQSLAFVVNKTVGTDLTALEFTQVKIIRG